MKRKPKKIKEVEVPGTQPLFHDPRQLPLIFPVSWEELNMIDAEEVHFKTKDNAVSKTNRSK